MKNTTVITLITVIAGALIAVAVIFGIKKKKSASK